MSDKLTDEQCDAIIAAMPIVGLGSERDWFHALIRAGRASLPVPPDVAALTDEQFTGCKTCGQLWAMQIRDCQRIDCPYAAGRASLPVAADVAALIARLQSCARFHNGFEQADVYREAAAALQAQAEQITKLEADRNWNADCYRLAADRAETAEARVTEWERIYIAVKTRAETAEAALEAAQVDARRIDWIDKQGLCGFGHIKYGDFRHYCGDGFKDARTVIDAAIAQEKK